MLSGTILERMGEVEESLSEFSLGLGWASERKLVAEAMANMAVRLHLLNRREEAKSLIREAYQYCPDSWFVKRNLEGLFAIWAEATGEMSR